MSECTRVIMSRPDNVSFDHQKILVCMCVALSYFPLPIGIPEN